jgi:hypothetical protein
MWFVFANVWRGGERGRDRETGTGTPGTKYSVISGKFIASIFMIETFLF